MTIRSGIYFLKSNNEIIYIGKTTRGISRIYQHKTITFDDFVLWPAPPESLDLWEKAFIKFYQPKFNQTHNKSKNIMRYEDELGRPRWRYVDGLKRNVNSIKRKIASNYD